MILGYCRKPYEDELLYGYIHDLFLKNGFYTMADVDRLLNSHVRVNYTTALPFVCDAVRNVTFPDVMQAIRMTPYGALVDGRKEQEAARYAEMYLQAELPYAPARPTKGTDVLHVCPICQAEDRKKHGTWYLHVSHHLPGVTVCAKHGCRLYALPVPRKQDPVRAWDTTNMESVDMVEDVKQAVRYARMQVQANLRNADALVRSKCPDCGREYVEHSYSKKTACGCPYCNQQLAPEDVVRRRLTAAHRGEYDVAPGFQSLYLSKAVHKPCGSSAWTVARVLYGGKGECAACTRLAPERLQHRFDPEKKEWEFCGAAKRGREGERISVRHLACGHSFKMTLALFVKKEVRCPYCGKEAIGQAMLRMDREKNRVQREADARRMLHEEIRKATLRKGFWCMKDAREAGVEAPYWRIKRLEKMGCIRRVGPGRYKTEGERL